MDIKTHDIAPECIFGGKGRLGLITLSWQNLEQTSVIGMRNKGQNNMVPGFISDYHQRRFKGKIVVQGLIWREDEILICNSSQLRDNHRNNVAF